MAIAYLGLGTNIGNKRRNMITAAALLAERVGDILALSGFFFSVGIIADNPADRKRIGARGKKQRSLS